MQMSLSYRSYLRFYRRVCFSASYSVRRYVFYIMLVFATLLMAWEASVVDAAVAGQTIPQEAIRLRILANSDAPADQLLKRKVRDAVVEQMNRWVTEPDHIEQAREVIQANLSVLEQVVQDTIAAYGYAYESKVELGQAEFPAKLYGQQVYPAGMYEALRISIGKAEGQNWWCVLFPPLCFVDMVSGGSEPVAYAADGNVEDVQTAASAAKASDRQTEARFFLWEMLNRLVEWIGSWF